MSCHARRRPIVFCPMAVMSCHDRPRCSPRVMISCHAPRRPTVGAVQGRRWHAKLDVIRPCVLSKGGDGMPRLTSCDRLWCPRAVISCHARRRPIVFCPMAMMSCHERPRCSPRAVISCLAPRRPTVSAVQGRRWHATPDVIQPCVLSKGSDCMPHPMSSDCLCCPKAMIACHARRRLTVCAVPRR